MSWVAILIIGALAISAGLNGLVHLIFKLTGGHLDSGDEEE
ncbi:hypothetical protein CXIVA_04870 [Clostridium sp. SY8519]|nr:hypothetical protein [Clostridium sp. SY8519]BAK46454.1 hypothetical protein CXIVA_04870 [Clostridium sp. SY8519]